tara:strand:- start:549 stop:830 length:282 start_codon:yes stop_codon:yes gene_type:complete
MYITEQQVEEYMSIRTDESLRHCPEAISEACNEVLDIFKETNETLTAKDLLRLLFFNDPIPSLHTHNYGFHTATGRHIIETLKEKYYEYESIS